MIFWTIIGIILTLTCIGFIIYINKNWRAREKNWPFACAIVAGAFAFLTFFTTIIIKVSYIEFEQKFMIQKETYSQINFNPSYLQTFHNYDNIFSENFAQKGRN